MKIIPFSLNKDTTISYWRYIDDYSLFDATILKGHMNGYIFIDDDKVFSIKTIESPMIHLFEKDSIRCYMDGFIIHTYSKHLAKLCIVLRMAILHILISYLIQKLKEDA